MSLVTRPESVCQEIFVYLSSLAMLTPEIKKEIRARVYGHRNAAAQGIYERNAKEAFVYELCLEDCTGNSTVELAKTLECLPHHEAPAGPLAEVLARQLAARIGQPAVMCDGNFENAQVFSPEVPGSEGFAVYRTLGTVVNAYASTPGEVGVHDIAVEGTFDQLHAAAGYANAYVKRLRENSGPNPDVARLVMVVNVASHQIVYRCLR